MSVQYGTYLFPEPKPLISFSDEGVFVAGDFDHSDAKITLNGIITGQDFAEIDQKKSEMIEGLSSRLQSLTINEVDIKSYDYCDAQSLSFEESDIATFLPYSVQFSSFNPNEVSEYFGVTEPQDSWSFTEEDEKVILASHTVSAIGRKVDASSAIDNAKSFVDSRIGNTIDSVSAFFNPTDYFLYSTEEKISEADASYSIIKQYKFKDADAYSYVSSLKGIITASSSISYSLDNGLEGTFNGKIQGELGSNNLATTDFTVVEAETIFKQFALNSKAVEENYSLAEVNISTFTYDIDEAKNSIDFSFSFKTEDSSDGTVNGVNHDYSITTDVSKEDGSLITTSINGKVYYKGSDLVAQDGLYELNAVYLAVSAAFAAIDTYGLAFARFSDFYDAVATEYNSNPVKFLNATPKTYNIKKDPVENTITYSYNYDTKEDEDNSDLSISITDNRPLSLSSLVETINGFCVQEDVRTSAGKLTVSASFNGADGDISSLQTTVDNLIIQIEPNAVYYESSDKSIAEESISFSATKYYQIPIII